MELLVFHSQSCFSSTPTHFNKHLHPSLCSSVVLERLETPSPTSQGLYTPALHLHHHHPPLPSLVAMAPWGPLQPPHWCPYLHHCPTQHRIQGGVLETQIKPESPALSCPTMFRTQSVFLSLLCAYRKTQPRLLRQCPESQYTPFSCGLPPCSLSFPRNHCTLSQRGALATS